MREDSLALILLKYLKKKRSTIIFYFTCIIIFSLVFYLYSIDMEPILYSFLLTSSILIIYFIYDFSRYYTKHKLLYGLKIQSRIHSIEITEPKDLIEEDYQGIIENLYNDRLSISSNALKKHSEMVDYYSMWAHQIKTPISAMSLLLQGSDNKENKALQMELFKIEQYVEMVLGYLRIEDSSSDLVLQNYSLDNIVKQSIRKYAAMFIRKNISLDFRELNCTILTDEKWILFVMEQILSNALKYTNKGKISIYMDDKKDKVLVIEDTGIGIAEEDLPRVFEKGFTGYNGRMDKKATGIGLYLCEKILNKLSHNITITSKVGEGTKVYIDLSTVKTVIE